MKTKIFEVRDNKTHIEVIATKLKADNVIEEYNLGHCGFDSDIVMLTNLETMETNYDSYNWDDTRTIRNAHNYINEHFDELENCAVIDIEFILGETKEPKISDRFYCGGMN